MISIDKGKKHLTAIKKKKKTSVKLEAEETPSTQLKSYLKMNTLGEQGQDTGLIASQRSTEVLPLQLGNGLGVFGLSRSKPVFLHR